VQTPVTFTGTAQDDKIVERVELIIRNSDDQYWNGNNFQSQWVVQTAELNNENWQYQFVGEPGGDQKVLVRARAYDTAGNRQTNDAYTSFTARSDRTLPESVVVAPLQASTVRYPATIVVDASDDSTVTGVSLLIKDIDNREYWNGSSFQPEWIQVDATLDNGRWVYELDASDNRRLIVKSRATDSADNVESPVQSHAFSVLDCSHQVTGTATPANSGTPTIIDVDEISYATGTVISANFFNSGAIIDRNGRTVSVCVTHADSNGARKAQIVTDVGRTDNTLIKAYPEFIVGSKFGLVGETSYRPYPALTSDTGFTYPDLTTISGLVGLPAFTHDLPEIDIVIDMDEENVIGAERDVMLESWFYDTAANATAIGNDAAGNPLVNTLNNIVGDGHPNEALSNLALEMMVHIGALSQNDVSRATRNPAAHRLTDSPIRIGDYHYHLWYGATGLSPLVVYSRETNRAGDREMDLSIEGEIQIDWNQFLEFTLHSLEPLLAAEGVSWASGNNNVFPVIRNTGAIGGIEFGVEPQTNNPDDQPYVANINKLDIRINGQQFGFF